MEIFNTNKIEKGHLVKNNVFSKVKNLTPRQTKALILALALGIASLIPNKAAKADGLGSVPASRVEILDDKTIFDKLNEAGYFVTDEEIAAFKLIVGSDNIARYYAATGIIADEYRELLETRTVEEIQNYAYAMVDAWSNAIWAGDVDFSLAAIADLSERENVFVTQTEDNFKNNAQLNNNLWLAEDPQQVSDLSDDLEESLLAGLRGAGQASTLSAGAYWLHLQYLANNYFMAQANNMDAVCTSYDTATPANAMVYDSGTGLINGCTENLYASISALKGKVTEPETFTR